MCGLRFKYLFFILCVVAVVVARAQEVVPLCDTTLTSQGRFHRTMQRISDSKAYRMTYVALPAIAAGVALQGNSVQFRTLRNDYIPDFHSKVDDYVQYSPAVLMVGLKAFGVKGRSSWGRMLTADAFAIAICTAVTQSIKYTAGYKRPDGSNRKSFPSGHTATAFMVASMLHHEYGLTRSRWYSIGGYSVALATGVMRMANNKHWISDVVSGAGIGILSVELAYLFAELIYKDRYITRDYLDFTWDPNRAPSFLGLYMGYNFVPGSYGVVGGHSVSFKNSGCVGVEGAWFWNSHWGVGARMTAASQQWRVDGGAFADDNLEILRASVGAYYSYPLARRWLVGAKLMAGYAHSSKVTYGGQNPPPEPAVAIGGCDAVSLGTGLSTTFLTRASMGITLFVDYDMSSSLISRGGAWTPNIVAGGQFNIAF